MIWSENLNKTTFITILSCTRQFDRRRWDIDAMKKLPGEGFKRPWPPLIKMDAAVKAKVEKLFGGAA